MDFSSTIPKAVPALREWRLKLLTQREENKGYNHYLRPTFALPTPYLGRFMFGFRLGWYMFVARIIFAVFAKIPPPTTTSAAWLVFVATWRAASH